MARKKTKSGGSSSKPSSRSTWGRAKQLLWQRSLVLVALAVVALLGWGMHVLWQHVAPSVIHRDRYLLTADRITISTPPAWITADVAAEVIRNSGLDRRLSLLDENFVQTIQDAFVLHPWVKSVDRITKLYPPGVHVELTYRRPVAVVEMASPNGVQLVPVDKQGVHLPENDVPEIRKRYLPRIGGIVGRPPVGQPWVDPRVTGAAELAERLGDVWESLHLVDILPSARPEIQDEHRYYVFDLITSGGTRVVWGAVSSAAPPGEDSFETKLHRLRQCTDQYGPLDSVRGPAIVDIRHDLAVTPRTVKKPPAAGKDAAVIK